MLKEITLKEALLRYIRGENVNIMIPSYVDGYQNDWTSMTPSTLESVLDGVIYFHNATEDEFDLEQYGKARMDSYEPTIAFHEEANEEINPVVAEGEQILDEWLEEEPMTAAEVEEVIEKIDEVPVEVEQVEEPKEFKPRTIHKGNGPKPSNKPAEFDMEKAQKLRDEGLSYKTIGEALGVSQGTAYVKLNRKVY